MNARRSATARIRDAIRGLMPRRGDVVVEHLDDAEAIYTVGSRRPKTELKATRPEALRTARSWAAKALVDLWYCEGPSYRLLEAYRPRH
jgi:hypothetical protein